MVAIDHTPDIQRSTGSLQSSAFADEDKYRLVYSKSKVYVNPTAYARDNIPGFVSLVKRVSLELCMSPPMLTFQDVGGCQPNLLAGLDTRNITA